MEVTKDNFSLVLPSIEAELNKCDFYTFDLEMTGINLPQSEQKEGSHDNAAQPGSFLTADVEDCIYPNKDMAARKFNIIQLGLSLFSKVGESDLPEDEEADALATELEAKLQVEEDGDGKKDSKKKKASPAPLPGGGTAATQYQAGTSGSVSVNLGNKIPSTKRTYTHKSFNFYLFPSFSGGSPMGTGCKKQVVLDAETVGGFLTEHGMDFTKWISKGIPYVTAEEAAAIREKGTGSVDDFAPLAAKDSLFQSFLHKAQALAETRKSSENFDFPYFPNMTTMNTAISLLKVLGLKKVTLEGAGSGSKKKYVVQVDPNFEAGGPKSSMERSLGAFRLYEAMVKCRKPVIAHNCLSDLLFLYHAFHSTPPKDYAAFKTNLSKDFPLIFDTRTLATVPEVGFDIDCVGNLAGQYRYFTERCKKFLAFEHQLGFDHFHPTSLQTNSRGAHEAAYDAYMTGCLFLALQLKLSGSFDFDPKVMAYGNTIAVFGSCVSTRLGVKAPKDVILNKAPILFLQYPEGTSGCSPRQVDGCFSRNDLRGRVMNSQGGAVIFCGFSSGADGARVGPTSTEEFDEMLSNVRKHTDKTIPGSKLWVIYDPKGIAGSKKSIPGVA